MSALTVPLDFLYNYVSINIDYHSLLQNYITKKVGGEEMKTGNGMVSGVCIGFEDKNNPTIILVKNADGKKPEKYGLPGGIIENNDRSVTRALYREWEEEVEKPDPIFGLIFLTECGCEIIRNEGTEREHEWYLFAIEDQLQTLRNHGMPGETEAPERIFLHNVIYLEDFPIFYSHLKGILAVLEKMAACAPHVPELSFLARDLRGKIER
ncbi:NUDIX hydrolase [Patescibacteria group bacterium]